MLEAPIGHGASVFIWIAVVIIGFAAALTNLDYIKERFGFGKKSESEKKH